METPSLSSRTITRSNNSIPISSRKSEESEMVVLNSRSALIDITNDSPIVGLAIGSLKTPSSRFSKKRIFIQNSELKQPTTPGSGEALLRGQVKTLLQKVEEEAVFPNISLEPRTLILEQEGFVNSPMYVLAPTPANTPQVSESCENNNGLVSPIVDESFNLSQMLDQEEENEETLVKNSISKLLFRDFPEKLEDCDKSVEDEDDESVWSVEVNVSTSDEELEENYEDGVCEVLSKVCVNDDGEDDV